MTRKTMGLRLALYMVMVLTLGLLVSGCSDSPSASPSGDSNWPTTLTAWISGGSVAANEYTQSQKFGDIEIFTRLGEDEVYIAIQSKKEGYLSLGIRPEEQMQGGDIITCVMDGSQARVYDTYSYGTFGPHPEDTAQGGTDDIMEVSGSRQNGLTTFEFKRRLNTGDSRDKALVAGNNPIMWAIGPGPDISARHSSRGYGNLVIQ